MSSARGMGRLDPRRKLAERIREEFATRQETAEIRASIADVQRSVDALAERLGQVEERMTALDSVADLRREIAVLRTGVRAVTNTVAALDEQRAVGS